MLKLFQQKSLLPIAWLLRTMQMEIVCDIVGENLNHREREKWTDRKE